MGIFSDLSPSSYVKEPVRTSLSSLLTQSHTRTPLIPTEDPNRPHFSHGPIAVIDSGFKYVDGGRSKVVTLPPSQGRNGNIDQDGSNASYPFHPFTKDCIKSHTWCDRGDVGYTIAVPSEDSYDVTLIFAAVTERNFKLNAHLLNVEIEGTERHLRPNLDPIALAGVFRPCVISFNGVHANKEIKIRVSRTAPSDAYNYINGLVVAPSNESTENCLLSPDVVVVFDAGRHSLILNSNVSMMPLSGPAKVTIKENLVTHPDPILRALCSSILKFQHNFGIDIAVPEPGIYDVSVCFCEIEKAEIGTRIMDLQVAALDVFEKEALDIRSEVGLYTPYVLTCNAMRVKDFVKVRLLPIKGAATISGVVVTKATELEQDKTSNAELITSVNCGSGNGIPDHDSGMEGNILCTGPPCSSYPVNSAANPICEDELFAEMGRICQRATGDSHIEYTFTSRSAEVTKYDVALVFCELDVNACKIGNRVLSVEVKGSSTATQNKIDIFKEVGAHRSHICRFLNIEVGQGGTLVITVRKDGGTKEAILNGFLITPSDMDHPLMEELPLPAAFVSCVTDGLPAHMDCGAGPNVSHTSSSASDSYPVVMSVEHPLVKRMTTKVRYAALKYEVVVETAQKYDVILFLADCESNSSGQRVFSIEVSGIATSTVQSVDIVGEVGKGRPLVLQFNDIDVDKLIRINLIQEKGDPCIGGFIIYSSGEMPRGVSSSFVSHEVYDSQTVPRN